MVGNLDGLQLKLTGHDAVTSERHAVLLLVGSASVFFPNTECFLETGLSLCCLCFLGKGLQSVELFF